MQVSQGGGRKWETVAVGVHEPKVAIHPDNLIPDRAALVALMATGRLRMVETTVEWRPDAD